MGDLSNGVMTVRLVTLPKGTFAQLEPLDEEFYDLAEPRAMCVTRNVFSAFPP